MNNVSGPPSNTAGVGPVGLPGGTANSQQSPAPPAAHPSNGEPSNLADVAAGKPSVAQTTTATAISDNGLVDWAANKLAPPLISGVTVAILGSFLIARAVERTRNKLDHLNKAVDSLRTDLANVQKLGAQYWARGMEKTERVMLEAEIEFTLRNVSSMTILVAPELWRDKNSPAPNLVSDLLDTVMGENFARSPHKGDRPRVNAIAQRTAAFSAELAIERRKHLDRLSPILFLASRTPH